MSHPDPRYDYGVELPNCSCDDADGNFPDYGRGLFCPHCNLWIGDPADPEIAHLSIDHDLSECERNAKH